MPETATRWTRLREAVSHAFAVRHEPLSEAQLQLLDRLAQKIHKRRLSPVAAGGVELLRPIAGLTGHSVTFLEPMLSAFVPAGQIEAARELLQHPDAIDALQERLAEEGTRNEERGARESALHPPLGRVERSEGRVRVADVDAIDAQVDSTSPPRNSADAAFRPSQGEGEDVGPQEENA